MPKITPQQELDAITRIIQSQTQGYSVGELLALENIDYTRRTLQRRLETLLQQGVISAQGEGRGRRYYIHAPQNHAKTVYYADYTLEKDLYDGTNRLREDSEPYRVIDKSHSWLSPEGREIKQLVARPLNERTPIAYQVEFLGEYVPNQTFYLSQSIRDELARVGQVDDSELPAGTYLRHLLDRLIIDLSWNSSRLEGNTFSILETERLLLHGQSVNGKAVREARMLLNHKAAIEMLADQAWELGFNRYTVCSLHALLSEDLMRHEIACGKLREVAVGISMSVFYPLEVPQMIEEQFMQILEKAEAIHDPFEAAFFILVHLPYLQPFEDVNKRTSRLAANIPMVQKNLCPLSFVDVDKDLYTAAMLGVYELNRTELLRDLFVWSYKRSCQRYDALKGATGNPDPFALQYRDEFKDCVREVVLAKLNTDQAHARITAYAEDFLPENVRKPFILVAKAKLRSMHEGNIARFKLRPSEYFAWQAAQ